jgi:hypothetical protein
MLIQTILYFSSTICAFNATNLNSENFRLL